MEPSFVFAGRVSLQCGIVSHRNFSHECSFTALSDSCANAKQGFQVSSNAQLVVLGWLTTLGLLKTPCKVQLSGLLNIGNVSKSCKTNNFYFPLQKLSRSCKSVPTHCIDIMLLTSIIASLVHSTLTQSNALHWPPWPV